MDSPWTTHVLSESKSDILRPLLKYPYSVTTRSSASGQLFAVGRGWEVSSISLSDFSVSPIKMEFARPRDPKPPFSQTPVLSGKDRYLVLLSRDHKRLYKFDLECKEWAVKDLEGPCPAQRNWATFTVCSSKLYLFGGLDGSKTALNDLWRLDVRSDQPGIWEMVNPDRAVFPPPRSHHGAVSTGKTLLIIGGQFQDDASAKYTWRDDTWEYNPKKNSWTRLPVTSGPHYPNHLLRVGGTLFSLSRTTERGYKLAALKAMNVSNRSQDWLDLKGFNDNESSAGFPFIFSDEFRILVPLGVRLEKGRSLRFHILETERVMNPRSNQPLLNIARLRCLFLVKPDIAAGKVHLIKLLDGSVARGGFCDVYIGTHEPSQIKLALKRPKVSDIDAANALRRIQREVDMWSTFDHENILLFLGTLTIDRGTYLVSPWMEWGDLACFSSDRVEYLKEEEKGNVTRSPRHDLYHGFDERRVIQGIAAGIAYLHSKSFVHGDLKGKNVLLGEDNKPLLCDFGITKALDSSSARTSTGMKGIGTARWQSPELFMNESKTYKSDVYAFAMVIVEVLTGTYPIPALNDIVFIGQVVYQDRRPVLEPISRKGIDFAPLWAIAVSAWAKQPEDRPSIDDILSRLSVIPISGKETK